MARPLKVRSIKRKEIDEDKLALAFLMLAKILHERETEAGQPDENVSGTESRGGEAR
jgi:hypothetical protein